MATEKTRAIVVRLVDFSESSCVVTLFTEDFGKIGTLAKGARRPKGPFDSALDLLAVCRIVFIHKSSDGLDLLTEARLDRRFRAATRSLSRLYTGYYVAELLQELTDYGDPHTELFRLADRTLIHLDGDCDPVWGLLQFEVSALRLLGYLPSLDSCVGCGDAVSPEGRVLFGQLSGGVLCQACRRGRQQVVSLSRAGLEILQKLAGRQIWEEMPPPDRRAMGEVNGLLNHYVVNLLGRSPRMQNYLGFLTT